MRLVAAAVLLFSFVTCFDSKFGSELELKDFLDKVEKGEEAIDISLINICVENSWWEAGERVISLSYKLGLDISSEFSRAISKQRLNFQKLQNLINANKEDYSVISPAFQWAQGKEDLKINVKLSHKWDTPATLGCSIDSVKFSPMSVRLEAKCPSTKKKFILNLTLQGRINPDACDWNEAAVGRVVINMKKYESGLWDGVIVKMKNMPKNIHTWWTMQDKLEKEDKDKDDAEQSRLDEQRRKAEEEYWAQKKIDDEKKEEEKKNIKDDAAEKTETVEEVHTGDIESTGDSSEL